jgi:peptidoglycan/xylan/chitin deacetylase (PgdA/CDA1 family)
MRKLLTAVKRDASPAVKTLLLRTGACGAIRRISPNRTLAILRYHAICAPDAGYASADICVSPGAFERHVSYLVANYRVVSLPDAVRALRDGRALPPNAVAITFDDGYRDNLAAAEVLKRYGATATFYITAGCVGEGQPFWPAELRYLVAALSGSTLELAVEDQPVVTPVGTPAEKQAAVARLTKIFKSVRIPVREELRATLRSLAPTARMPRVMLSWDEVRQMAAMGMTIGAHTVTHPNLPSAGADAVAEIYEAKEILEGQVRTPVTMFSYPNGGAERYFTPEIQRFVQRAGYEAATTSRNGFATRTSDPFALERVQVSERLEDVAFRLEVERFAFRPGQ